MTITKLIEGLPNQSMSQADFDAAAARYMAELPAWAVEVNATKDDMNGMQISASTSAAVATAQANAAIAAANATPWVSGSTYSVGDTRYSLINLQSYRRRTNGAGATDPLLDGANWAPTSISGVADEAITVGTTIGYGSVNTKILRFSTILSSVGSAITYADSATAGATFTINETGLYEVFSSIQFTSPGSACHGASLNSSQLTTNVNQITAISRHMIATIPNTGDMHSVSRTSRFTAGDVIRPHTNGIGSATGESTFSIRKIGNA